MVNQIRENITAIRQGIAEAAKKSGREAKDVKLMAVSKFHPLDAMLEASGDVDLFGENRVQEAAGKRAGWPKDGHTPWHLIGHLQSNKARKALEIFDAVETVDSLSLARMLDRILSETKSVGYPIFIEVNMSGEISKDGVDPIEAAPLLERILTYCPNLLVRGLMTIGPNTDDMGAVRGAFAGLRELRDRLSASFGIELPELSMGMSGDYAVAIEEGGTIVRVGTAIFGQRA